MIESVQKQMEMHLDTLEIDSSNSWDDIEKQYRQLIQRWHPDRNLGENKDIAQSKFIEINSAYKALREQYRKNGAIPRHLPPEQQGPLLGTKKEVVVKPALYKNKIVVAAVLGIALLSVFGAVLWSLDSRLAENNRDRATIEKTTSGFEAAATHGQQMDQLDSLEGSIIQTTSELEP